MINVIENRFSKRKFTKDKVEKQLIEKIISLAK